MKRMLVIITVALLCCGCAKDVEENLFCQVSLQAVLPDGRNIVSLTVDPSLPGNLFRNLNTGINYTYPVFVNNVASLRVQKGVYQIGFDGEALFQDGSHARVRFTAWNTPLTAVNLLEDNQTLSLNLILLK
ncbi:MAG: hypothetical protein IJ701_00750 [Bacteroidales bacterium]|nr:hypothetical protein [Bacteroidales bacterium]